MAKDKKKEKKVELPQTTAKTEMPEVKEPKDECCDDGACDCPCCQAREKIWMYLEILKTNSVDKTTLEIVNKKLAKALDNF
jgi:hypothetical protein